jgi:hypothetical protein
LNPLLFGYHTTGDAVTGVSGGIGFHVVCLGVHYQRPSAIAENGVAFISPIHISVDDPRFRVAIRVLSEGLHIASMTTSGFSSPCFLLSGLK